MYVVCDTVDFNNLELGDEVLFGCSRNDPDMQKWSQTIQISVALAGKFGCCSRDEF